MRCAWKELLNILPLPMREEIDQLGKSSGQEIRLFTGRQGILVTKERIYTLKHSVSADDLLYVINTASRYSPWTIHSIAKGYVTAPGGHRIGICGQAVNEQGMMTGISKPSSLCIRIARDFSGIARDVPISRESILIIGPPGAGKTTFLRDLIRQCSEFVCVIDEKEEIFPIYNHQSIFDSGDRIHVLSGVDKRQGIEAVLKNMGPSIIAVDEITAREDCEALCSAAWCGVTLVATAHAESRDGLLKRKIYEPLTHGGLFNNLVVIRKDQSWYFERMNK